MNLYHTHKHTVAVTDIPVLRWHWQKEIIINEENREGARERQPGREKERGFRWASMRGIQNCIPFFFLILLAPQPPSQGRADTQYLAHAHSWDKLNIILYLELLLLHPETGEEEEEEEGDDDNNKNNTTVLSRSFLRSVAAQLMRGPLCWLARRGAPPEFGTGMHREEQNLFFWQRAEVVLQDLKP